MRLEIIRNRYRRWQPAKRRENSLPMLGECVDDTPKHDDPAVIPLLRAPALAQPRSTHAEHENHDDTVDHKGRAHNEVSETLASFLCGGGDEVVKKKINSMFIGLRE